MAVQMIEGFDTFSSSQVSRRYASYNGVNISSPGRYGLGSYLNLSSVYGSGSSYLVMPVPARTEYFFGFDINPQWTGDSTWSEFLYFRDNSNPLFSFFNNNYNVDVYSNVTDSWIGQSSVGSLPLGYWQSIWFHCVVSPTVGALTVIVDGITVLDFFSINTGSTFISNIVLCGGYQNDNNQKCNFDNVWVFDTSGTHSNTWPVGNMIVQTVSPLTDGTYQQWTPDFGASHYGMVHDIPADDDTTYVSSVNPGDIDTYGISFNDSSVAQVHGVRAGVVARQDTSSMTKQIAAVVKSGSALSVGPTLSTTSSYQSTSNLLENDPNTSTQWTTTSIAAMEIGEEAIY
jgi:hypothetical protein